MSDFEYEGDRGIAATDRTAIVHASFITYMHLDYRDIATVPSALEMPNCVVAITEKMWVVDLAVPPAPSPALPANDLAHFSEMALGEDLQIRKF